MGTSFVLVFQGGAGWLLARAVGGVAEAVHVRDEAAGDACERAPRAHAEAEARVADSVDDERHDERRVREPRAQPCRRHRAPRTPTQHVVPQRRTKRVLKSSVMRTRMKMKRTKKGRRKEKQTEKE